uniref:Transposase n=1 Tax=Planktothrix agardhii NIES-596 TaxID=443922 RepID=F5B703_PLAAG|nr:transposase [Planktothrix agardhii NIES-596]
MIAKIINYYMRSLIYKGFCQRYKPKEKTPTQCHWGSKLLAGVHLSEKGSTTNPKKSKSRLVQTPCQVSESPELTRIVSQFIEANRAPRETEKDF